MRSPASGACPVVLCIATGKRLEFTYTARSRNSGPADPTGCAALARLRVELLFLPLDFMPTTHTVTLAETGTSLLLERVGSGLVMDQVLVANRDRSAFRGDCHAKLVDYLAIATVRFFDRPRIDLLQ